MKRFGTVSYNIYCNFTNYGSALQSWALCRIVDKLGAGGRWQSVLVDYCPDVLRDKDPLDPMKNMWDKDEVSRRMCELSLPAIRINYEKFDRFYHEAFNRTKNSYTSGNFCDIVDTESLDGFICGSDTIFCPDEFGFDDGYYANYPCMKDGFSISYAASFGDAKIKGEQLDTLRSRLGNFKAIGLRESTLVDFVRANTDKDRVNVCRTLDPTLLLCKDDFETIACRERLHDKPYLLLYARRYNSHMEEYAERLAAENGWDIVEISLRAVNAARHRMFYEAGVDEFLSLVRGAELTVTNSYHGMIVSFQYGRPFTVFSREQCDTKISELLEISGLSDLKLPSVPATAVSANDIKAAQNRLAAHRNTSLKFLDDSLSLCR